MPHTITLDGYAALHRAVRKMRIDGLLPEGTKLRSSKYLNNLIEQDHRGVKSRTRPMLGFKNFESAAITIAGVELLLRIHKKSIRLKSPEDQRPNCARDLECRARRVRHNITLSPPFGGSGYLRQSQRSDRRSNSKYEALIESHRKFSSLSGHAERSCAGV